MKKLTLLLLITAFLLAFGENPIRSGNIGKNAVTNEPALFDNNTGTKAIFSKAQADLQRLYMLDSIEIFQKERPEKVKTSIDIVNWQEYPLIATPYGWKAELNGIPVRYIQVQNSKPLECSEIALYPLEDYRLSFTYLDTQVSTDNCWITVQTNYPTYLQIMYGYNYEFIYHQRLPNVLTSLDITKNHRIEIKNLRPETTFRFQARVIDANERELRSDFFTFTTKEDKK